MTQRKIVGIVLVIASVLILGFLFVAYLISSFVIDAIETQVSEVNNNLTVIAINSPAVNNLNIVSDETLPDPAFVNEVKNTIYSAIFVLSLPGLILLIVGIYLIVIDKAKINPPQPK